MSRLILSDVNATSVILVPDAGARGLLGRFRKAASVDLMDVQRDDWELAYALARVRSLDPDHDQSVLEPDRLIVSHGLVARLEDVFACTLGLPPLMTELSFTAKMRGTIGSPDVRFDWWWERNGRKENVPRRGAILFPDIAARRMRVPEAVLQAIKLSEEFDPMTPIENHWQMLAAFRTLLGDSAEVTLDTFLKGLKIFTVTRIGIEITDGEADLFAPVPVEKEDQEPGMSQAHVESFQSAVRLRGVTPAYRLEDGAFAVIDGSAAPVLKVVAKAMQGDQVARRRFIQDAPRLIAEAIEIQLREAGKIQDDTPADTAAELIERGVDAGWTETIGWSDRVIGVGVALPAPDEIDPGSGLPWLPATVSPTIGEMLGLIPDDEVAAVIASLQRALLSGQEAFDLGSGPISVTPDVIEALQRRLAMMSDPAPVAAEPVDAYLPIVHDNLQDLDFFADVTQRSGIETQLPYTVKATLKGYQTEAFHWQVNAWKAGLPGVLNADEQGLGKTLQTLSFLAWLDGQGDDADTGPVLIVAPTSLLRNWQLEIDLHLKTDALGPIHQMYGPALSNWRIEGMRGRDIGDGETHLDLTRLAGKRGVIITTYQTLANFSVSFMSLKFSVAIFDEMQFVKNPRTQRAQAAKALNSEFSIGLTGTPIENKTQDLWSVLDIICPGALGPLARFNRVFSTPSDARLQQLQNALFDAMPSRPALCQRRTKKQADPTIPPKVRLMYPQEMPRPQAIRYDEARAKTGGVLEVLQHIRRVSAHPGLIESEDINDFIAASARTQATMDILRHIKSKGERALVFVENRDIQAWFIEILNIEFDLNVRLINGDTSVDDRQTITEKFQKMQAGVFDVLVLGPRAAGTGLTLTAANHVIHLTRWWNPAVEEQCNDRTHRISQTRPVTVHLPMAVHPDLGPASFDCLLHQLISRKMGLASNILHPMQVEEQDLRQLHDAAVSGRVTADEPVDLSLSDGVPGRDDLKIEELAEDVIRISSDEWPNQIVVVANKASGSLDEFINQKTDHLVAIQPPNENGVRSGSVPVSYIKDARLWPNFLLPY